MTIDEHAHALLLGGCKSCKNFVLESIVYSGIPFRCQRGLSLELPCEEYQTRDIPHDKKELERCQEFANRYGIRIG